MSENKFEKIIKGAELILSVCDGAFSHDEKGYDILDAGHFRGFLRYPDIFGVEGLTPEEVEWMRRKLLRYKRQLWKMGFETGILDQPIHSTAFFAHAKDWSGQWLRLSPHSLNRVSKDLVEDLKQAEKHNSWVNIDIGYKKGSILKHLWIRINDPNVNGKTRKWWE